MSWDTGPNSQPRGDIEKRNIAAEAMGGQTSGKPRAPRFHRMSIASGANGGATVEHTIKHFKRSPKEHGARDTQVTPSDSGPWGDGSTEKTTSHPFSPDHPIMKHIHAIHEHITNSLGNTGDVDSDGD